MDTTVWVGASDRNDDFHESSRSIVEAIRLGKLPLALTTDFVIDETVTILGKGGASVPEAQERLGKEFYPPPVFSWYTWKNRF